MILEYWLTFSLLIFVPFVQGYRNVVRPKHTTTTTETPKPWLRTIYSTQKEIVTPTVIAGITFSGKPKATPDPLEPWVSLKKDGTPETVKPQVKNGRTKNAVPDYSTYFQTMSIKTFSPEELEGAGLDPNESHEEEIFLEEDKTYVSLNPIIRCTPDRYFNKGLAKDVSSEPFCTPRENSDLKVDKTYFITWYTRFFEDENGKNVDQVRLHLSYVKEKAHDKGYAKREIPAAFFSSEWVKNVDGVYPLEISEEWLQEEYARKAVISIQPMGVKDEDFDPLEYGVIVNILLGSKVFKTTKQQLTLQDEGITDESWYYVAITIPTVVIIAVVFMYFFLQLNSSYRDFSDVKRTALNQRRRVIGKFKDMKKYRNIKNHSYEELPLHKSSKQS